MEQRKINQAPVLRDERTALSELNSDGILGILSKQQIQDYVSRRTRLGLEPG